MRDFKTIATISLTIDAMILAAGVSIFTKWGFSMIPLVVVTAALMMLAVIDIAVFFYLRTRQSIKIPCCQNRCCDESCPESPQSIEEEDNL
jgi:hypothetical protein